MCSQRLSIHFRLSSASRFHVEYSTRSILCIERVPLTHKLCSSRSQERADDENTNKGQILVQEESDALLRGEALGEGLELWNEGRRSQPEQGGRQDRLQSLELSPAGVKVQSSSTRASPMALPRPKSPRPSTRGDPSLSGMPSLGEQTSRAATEARIDNLFENIGGWRSHTPASDPEPSDQRLLSPAAPSSNGFSWRLR